MRQVIFAVSTVILAFVLVGCNTNTPSASVQQEQARDRVMEVANSSVRTPEVSNFVTRESVVEYMNRMDEPNKTFYVYVIADTGQALGYYVSRGAPVNICTFLTPPDRVHRDPTGKRHVRAAPGADGVYYGASACNTEYFFDAQTDAMVQIQGLNLFVSDQPLELDAQPIRVKTE